MKVTRSEDQTPEACMKICALYFKTKDVLYLVPAFPAVHTGIEYQRPYIVQFNRKSCLVRLIGKEMLKTMYITT
ncbi:hypothetical protein EV146_104381 [Mesobacillus foraminis]|uniref:Uncharacterized protein n=1 Tax=Mesobacillus foraminis TaxID=279826 RepID=A0A4R2BH02_9BACI|nr:hypothetical protein EV146_104381 [Mesobacillus foraminis]